MNELDDIINYHRCDSALYWYGCYSENKYQKYVTKESYAHPAKMAFGILERIFKHLESMNLLTADSVVIDFMAGSGRTGTMAALHGYKTISVELEPHFIEMIAGYDCDGISISDFLIEPCACKSAVLHKPHKIRTGLCEVDCSGNPRIIPVCRCGTKIHHKKHHIPGNREILEQVTGRKVKWDVIMGDARELRRLMNLTDLAGVISPPYFSQTAFHDKGFIIATAGDRSQSYRNGTIKGHFATPEVIKRYVEKIMEKYSLDPQNIGNLPDAPFAAIISPPYQDTAMPMGCPSHIRKLAREGNWDKAIELERNAEAEQAKKGNKFAVSTDETIRKKIEMALEREKGNYSEDSNNIGNLKDAPLVSIMSPPYSEAQTGGGIAIRGYEGKFYFDQGNPDRVGDRCGYKKDLQGISEGQIGNLPDGNKGIEHSGSYLSAMLEVYTQARLCGISPLVVVVKNPTRSGKLRRLDLDTITLLQLSGYETFDYHRAILFESHKQETLEGDTKNVHKGRISFFKRLSLEKGTTVATWEDIIFARIP